MRARLASIAIVTASLAGLAHCSLDLAPFVPANDAGLLVADSGGGGGGVDATTPITDAAGGEGGAGDADAGLDGSLPRPDGGKRVFVTSQLVTGALGGVAGADARCAALVGGGSWVAWISTLNSPAIMRLTANGPWTLMDQRTRVFASRQAIVTTGPEAAIDMDEQGRRVERGGVWTGTQANGVPANQNCVDFTSGNADDLRNTALQGQATVKSTAWTQSENQLCRTTGRLYCFEN